MSPYSQQTAVILTHPVGNDDLLYAGLLREGIEMVCDPMIDTEQIKLEDECLKYLMQSRRIIFTAKRGVEYFFQQIKPADVLDKSFICIGTKTARVLEQHGMKAWWVSGGRTASDLVTELQQAHVRPHEKWVGILGELAENTLETGLKNVCDYKRYNVYRTIITTRENEHTLALFNKKTPVVVACTSPSCFNGFMNLYGERLHKEVGFASIGPATTKAMKKKDIVPGIVAHLSTYEGLWQEMKIQLKTQYR